MSDSKKQEDLREIMDAIASGAAFTGFDEEDLNSYEESTRYQPYNFYRPSFLSHKEDMLVRTIHQNAMRKFCGLYSRPDNPVRLHVSSVDKLRFDEFIHSTPITYPGISFRFEGHKEKVSLTPPYSIGFLDDEIREEFLKSRESEDEFLETKLTKEKTNRVIEGFLSLLEEAWSTIQPVKISDIKNFGSVERLGFQEEPWIHVVLVSMELAVGDSEGPMTLAYPVSLFHKLLPAGIDGIGIPGLDEGVQISNLSKRRSTYGKSIEESGDDFSRERSTISFIEYRGNLVSSISDLAEIKAGEKISVDPFRLKNFRKVVIDGAIDGAIFTNRPDHSKRKKKQS